MDASLRWHDEKPLLGGRWRYFSVPLACFFGFTSVSAQSAVFDLICLFKPTSDPATQSPLRIHIDDIGRRFCEHDCEKIFPLKVADQNRIMANYGEKQGPFPWRSTFLYERKTGHFEKHTWAKGDIVPFITTTNVGQCRTKKPPTSIAKKLQNAPNQ
jgi:hypothetical protein